MTPEPVQINAPHYRVQLDGYEVLKTITDTEKSSSTVGMVTEVAVPVGGVEIQFLSGGGHPVLQSLFVTTTWEAPKPAPVRPAPSPKPPKAKVIPVVETKPEPIVEPVAEPVVETKPEDVVIIAPRPKVEPDLN